MIIGTITLFWLIATIFTFRYSGYAKPRTVKAQYAYCPWPLTCSSCKCINCTRDLSSHHSDWHSACDDYSPTSQHTSEYVLAVAFAFLWPAYWMVWAIKQIPSRTGFFLPPPEIKSRENKLSERLEELELENARLEKEAGLYERPALMYTGHMNTSYEGGKVPQEESTYTVCHGDGEQHCCCNEPCEYERGGLC